MTSVEAVRHVVLEGTHGAGKTTAITKANVPAYKIPSFVVPYETIIILPGNPRARYQINDISKCAIRRLDPTLSTLSDRSYSSSLAYAAFVADQEGTDEYLAYYRDLIERSISTGLLKPADSVVVFDILPVVAWQRIVERDGATWATFAEVEFLRRFHVDPPDWYIQLVCQNYVVHESGTLEINVSFLEGLFA